jgi:Domain of unknown function (DUF6379)
MAKGNVFGYETYMICEDGFRNVKKDDVTVGFELQMRIANYRGYLLSQIEDIRIAVDGEAIPRGDIRFSINGRTYTLDEMESVVDNSWGLTQRATVTCLKAGGLSPGAHEIAAEEHIRASYIPMLAVARLTKTLRLN